MRLGLFILMIGILIIPFVKAIKDKNQIYQLPFLFSISTFAFIFPTLFSETISPSNLSEKEFSGYILNLILCLIFSFLGYYLFNTSNFENLKINKYNLRKLKFITSFFFIIGFLISYFFIDPSKLGGETSGLDAILVYFGRMMRPTIFVFMFIYLLKKDKWSLFMIILYLISSLRFIVISGRRSEVFVLALLILLPLFFLKKYIPPLKFSIIGIIFGFAVFTILPVARDFTKQGEFDKVLSITFSDIVQDYVEGNSSNEVIEAAINQNIVRENFGYSFGLRFLNKFVHQFVSSTIFGRDFKEALSFDTFDIKYARSKNFDFYGYKYYLTPTGYTDTFYDFGFLSFIIFYCFARISRVLWERTKSLDLFHQIFYSYFTIMIFMAVYDSISYIPTNIMLALIILTITKNNSILKT